MHLNPHKQQLPQLLRPHRYGAQLRWAPRRRRGALGQHDDVTDVEVRLRRQRPRGRGRAADVRGGELGAGGEAGAHGPAAGAGGAGARRRRRAGVRGPVQFDERAGVGRVGAGDVVVLVDEGEAEADARGVGGRSSREGGGGYWGEGDWWAGVGEEGEGWWRGGGLEVGF